MFHFCADEAMALIALVTGAGSLWAYLKTR
jgi:hypothetical protein